jgi:hypothetical protein
MSNDLQPSERVDYEIRPAKSTLRRVILEQLRHIQSGWNLREYTYMGFGSVAFVDFVLFERHLGFKRLISIEDKQKRRDRFEFCKPLGHIELKMGDSTKVLNDMNLSQPMVIWLDYDQPPSDGKLNDVAGIVERATLGTVVYVTVGLEDLDIIVQKQNTEKRLDYLKTYLAYMDDTSSLLKTVKRQIEVYSKLFQDVMDERARTRSETSKIAAMPILSATYSDGKQMLVLGWILLDPSERDKLSVAMDGCVGYPVGDVPLKITYPSLTRVERRHLDKVLRENGAGESAETDEHGIPAKEAALYRTFRRFLPSYAELEW